MRRLALLAALLLSACGVAQAADSTVTLGVGDNAFVKCPGGTLKTANKQAHSITVRCVPVASPTPPPSPSVSPTPSPTPTATASPVPTPTPTPTSLTSSGWEVFCSFSHSANDDPIVKSGQPGASHTHDFFGATTTDANSTYESMVASSNTCSPQTKDTAGYWTPALYYDGVKVDPATARTEVYYTNNLTGLPASAIQTIPPGLRMVAGNSAATSVAENPELGSELYYGCSNNSPDVKATAPISCTTNVITLHVGFPNCWDGVHLDSPDHQSHMAYPVRDSTHGGGYYCPASHPVPIPRVILRWEYPMPAGYDPALITLAGIVGGMQHSLAATYTVHGDFWNTWDQPILDRLVRDCINTQSDCGVFRI